MTALYAAAQSQVLYRWKSDVSRKGPQARTTISGTARARICFRATTT